MSRKKRTKKVIMLVLLLSVVIIGTFVFNILSVYLNANDYHLIEKIFGEAKKTESAVTKDVNTEASSISAAGDAGSDAATVAAEADVKAKTPKTGVLNKYLKRFIISPNSIHKGLVKNGLSEAATQLVNLLTTTDVNAESELDSYYIFIDPYRYDQLTSDLPKSGFEDVDGYLKYEDNPIQDVKLRFRGDSKWHWFFTQKSWRVKTDKDELVNGARKLNLVNPIEKAALLDYLSGALGEKMGILTASAEPCRVFLNNRYMGVAVSIEQTDEYFLRSSNKLPSELYAGDLIREEDGHYTTGYLWSVDGINAWEKMANNNAIDEDDFSYLLALIDIVEKNFSGPYNAEIEKVLDINKYITWRAGMTISASIHCDNSHNNKLYYDPSNGKFEYVFWDLDGFSYAYAQTSLNTIITDLDRLIMRNPVYVDAINQTTWETIANTATEAYLLQQIDDEYSLMKDDIYADVYKDFLGSNRLNRAYTNAQFDESVTALKTWIKARYAYLNEALTDETVTYSVPTKIDPSTYNFSITVDGASGAQIDDISFCGVDGSMRLYKDSNLNHKLDSGDMLVKESVDGFGNLEEVIYPAKRFVEDENIKHSAYYVLGSATLEYSYILVTNQDVESVSIDKISARNTVTGQAVHPEAVVDLEITQEGVFTTHPWALTRGEKAEETVFNEGEYVLDEDLIINKNSKLIINEGAVLKMKENVSICVFGRLEINGSEEKPAVIEPFDETKPWGVFAIQGHYNPDDIANINYAVIRGGGVPQIYENAMYTGMLSAYNVDLVMKNSEIIGNRVGDDAVNTKQGNVLIQHCKFIDANMDALDIDYGTGEVSYCYFAGSGNDSIDIMTTTVDIHHNYIVDSTDKGISIGERSNPTIYNNIFKGCEKGIEIKDLSDPVVMHNVFINNVVGINAYHKNDKYESGGRGTIISCIIANSKEDDLTLDGDSKLTVSDTVFGKEIEATKDLMLDGCITMDVDLKELAKNGYKLDIGDGAGLVEPLEAWWTK